MKIIHHTEQQARDINERACTHVCTIPPNDRVFHSFTGPARYVRLTHPNGSCELRPAKPGEIIAVRKGVSVEWL